MVDAGWADDRLRARRARWPCGRPAGPRRRPGPPPDRRRRRRPGSPRCGPAAAWPGPAGGGSRGRGSARASTWGEASRRSASSWAVALWRARRTPSVRRPRTPFMASNGEALAPWKMAKPHSQSISSWLPQTMPRLASLWPAMPLVAECRTRSTPWASGCWPSGVAKVESTQVTGPLMAPTSSRSTRSRRGLAGVSAKTSVVLPGPDGRGEGAGLGAVDQRHVDAEAGADAEQDRGRLRVELALGDDVVAGRADAEDDAGDRAHARGVGPGRLGPLEVGDGLLEGPHPRVAVAAVEAVGVDRLGQAGGLLGRLGLEGGRRPQQRAPGRRAGRPAHR